MSQVQKVSQALKAQADPKKAAFFPKFFKAGYSQNDQFLGVTVPKQRQIAKTFYAQTNLQDIQKLLKSNWHEERLTALFILVLKFNKAKIDERQKVIDFYLANLDGVNNWDLVDSSAYSILGFWLLDKDRDLLYKLAESGNLWERRVAIVATMTFIRAGQTNDTFAIAQKLLADKEDYIHKAVGWLLREAGKPDEASLRQFLDKHASVMPRTMLRYAIEKFTPSERARYLGRIK